MMHSLNNNVIAVFAILLIMLSVVGQLVVNMKVDKIEGMYGIEEVTGKISSTGTISFTVIRPLTDIDFHAELADDNQTVILKWENISQKNVSIYMTDNLTAGFNYGSPNVTGIMSLNWSDPTSGDVRERYYKIGFWYLTIFNISLNTEGKYDIPIRFASGNPATYELNQISLPLIPYNKSFQNVMRWGTANDVVLRFNTTDSGGQFEGWETNLKLPGGNWLTQFDSFSEFEGYIFPFVQNPYNLTIVGTVPTGTVEIPMVITTGAPATYEMMLLGWNSLRTDCDMTSALNTTTPPETMVWFDTTDVGATYQGWRTYLLMFNGTNWEWFPPGDCMRPGYGYSFLQIGAPYNWTYDRDI